MRLLTALVLSPLSFHFDHTCTHILTVLLEGHYSRSQIVRTSLLFGFRLVLFMTVLKLCERLRTPFLYLFLVRLHRLGLFFFHTGTSGIWPAFGFSRLSPNIQVLVFRFNVVHYHPLEPGYGP